MREIIAVCRSENQSRDRVAKVLDRYFWRIGDRTWRGKATNACLDRVARELRKRATRNTAVVLHEIRSSSESRKPIIRIGSRHAFSQEGVVPISSHPSDFRRGAALQDAARSGAAVVSIAALFHDLGKATNLFQAKLRRAINGGKPEADAVRHELLSAAVWDDLFGDTKDGDLAGALGDLTSDGIDESCRKVRSFLKRIHMKPEYPLQFRFIQKEGSLFHLIGMLILTHHRLPEGEADHLTLLGARHVRGKSPLNRDTDLAIAPGMPFWHEGWWLEALRTEAGHLKSDVVPVSGDIALRASLMFADHLGSAKKAPNETTPDHLANTTTVKGKNLFVPGDSLSRHVKRVYRYSRFAHEMNHALRDRYPALDEPALPTDIAFPEPSPTLRFSWQGHAARAARAMCETREGGFFAAIMAGTGTGKTRGAPTILAGAAMGDSIPERRYVRMSLGLGLRVLATQSAKEYVEDLGFASGDISVLVGDPPLDFRDPNDEEAPTESSEGSESLVSLPEWLRVEDPEGRVPVEGDEREERWLQGLSLDTDRGLPAFLDQVLEKAGKHSGAGRRLLQAPIMVGTIDHLMGVAAPVNSRFLLQSLRLMTSDLILDEIDQYNGEDLAAIGRLIFQAGAAGRRVIIMSATLTPDIAEALHLAYSRGWADHAKASGTSAHVNLLLCGNAPDAVFTNLKNESLSSLLDQCRSSILAGIGTAPILRRGEVLQACDGWAELVDQIDQGCSRLHDLNAVEIEEFRVSVGLVRMTRIAHTAALAVKMRSGNIEGRLRVLVCLHSQLPRLHRGYIETRLKRALTRKGTNPEAGVRALCQDEGVFEKAREIGTHEIEIVVVTTPVIETGNDVDFDWALLDPISTRSIIQSAGRVRRHRPASGDHPNVLILGRSPIAMEGGKLAMPGVETKLADETKVAKVEHLLKYEGRHFVDLAGEADFRVISAAPLLSKDTPFPLRDAEAHVRKQMLSTNERDPLGRYILHQNARWNLTMTRTRKFRRSEKREILFCRIGERPENAVWHLDLAPGTWQSKLREAVRLHTDDPYEVNCLFEDMTARGWFELSGGVSEMTSADISELLRVSVPTYGDDPEKEMTYTEFTGFTRGKPEDLFEAFGKSK
ncbi:CRISPR-associated endonuclease/helicase Cas3 [Roseovarius sp. MBR-51]